MSNPWVDDEQALPPPSPERLGRKKRDGVRGRATSMGARIGGLVGSERITSELEGKGKEATADPRGRDLCRPRRSLPSYLHGRRRVAPPHRALRSQSSCFNWLDRRETATEEELVRRGKKGEGREGGGGGGGRSASPTGVRH